MEHRNPKRVAFLTIITLGIYALVWLAKTKNEINEKLETNTIPTMWWFIIPLGSYWWMWLYSEALETMTKTKIKRNDTFLLYAITTMGIGFTTQFNVRFEPTIDIGIILILAVIVTIVSVAVFSIFPYVMQSKFNKLSMSE